jgi:hypothetical protein
MSKNNDNGKYWPYMILGFLAIGITLGYWTIKNTISLPVHESNEFMQKYQDADKDANEIIESQLRFNQKYNVSFNGLEKSDFKPKFLKRKPHQYYVLNEVNNLTIKVTPKSGNSVEKMDMVALLTRPQTELDDVDLNVTKAGNGVFELKDFKVAKLGRYIVRLKISDDKNDTKYLDIYGYRAK